VNPTRSRFNPGRGVKHDPSLRLKRNFRREHGDLVGARPEV